jgi:hypothetical protein
LLLLFVCAAGDVPPSEKQLLFVQKLHLCSFTFDFTDPTKHVREKEIKRQTLLELVDYANSGQGKFTEAVSEDIIFMLSNNLFRTLPPSRSHDVDNFDPEEEEPTLEPAWPHLQVRVHARCVLCAVGARHSRSGECLRAGQGSEFVAWGEGGGCRGKRSTTPAKGQTPARSAAPVNITQQATQLPTAAALVLLLAVEKQRGAPGRQRECTAECQHSGTAWGGWGHQHGRAVSCCAFGKDHGGHCGLK